MLREQFIAAIGIQLSIQSKDAGLRCSLCVLKNQMDFRQ